MRRFASDTHSWTHRIQFVATTAIGQRRSQHINSLDETDAAESVFCIFYCMRPSAAKHRCAHATVSYFDAANFSNNQNTLSICFYIEHVRYNLLLTVKQTTQKSSFYYNIKTWPKFHLLQLISRKNCENSVRSLILANFLAEGLMNIFFLNIMLWSSLMHILIIIWM